ncbi:MAG: hypothetical protein WBQ60_07155 [Asticcacaulis sp.]
MKPDQIVNPAVMTCAAMLLAIGVMVSGCATKPQYSLNSDEPHVTPPEPNRAQAALDSVTEMKQGTIRASNDEQSNSWGDAFMAPLEDLNVRKRDIPLILTQATTKPYDLSGLDTCEAIASEVTKLDSLLGADFDEPPAPADQRTISEKGGEAAKDMARGSVRNAARSIIPFRGLVRQITGAQRHQKEMDTAIQAGKVRRAYLKGVGMNKNCPPPAAPSWFVPRVYTDAYVPVADVPAQPIVAPKAEARPKATSKSRRKKIKKLY